MNTTNLIQQVVAQAGSVVIVVALLRLALRRVFKIEPDGDALLGLNLLANLVIAVAILLNSAADFTSGVTYGTLALVALSATVLAHGGYDLVTNVAKGRGGGSGSSSAASVVSTPSVPPAPSAPPVSADPPFPPGVSLTSIQAQLAPVTASIPLIVTTPVP